MASPAQIEANRRNAAGPHQMSEAGKQAVRSNAIRHGLAARSHVVIPGEDEAFFHEIQNSLRAEHAPASTLEEILVNQVAENYWRLLRARNMETASFSTGLIVVAEENGVQAVEPNDLYRASSLALACDLHDGILSKVARYSAAAERSYYRAIAELQKAQAIRHRQKPPEPPPAQAEIRSVPQFSPEEPAGPQLVLISREITAQSGG